MRTHAIELDSPSLYVPYPWYVSSNQLSPTQSVHFTLCGFLKGRGGLVPGIRLECITDRLTTRSRVLPEKLTVPQLDKKFPSWYGTRRFITALTSPCHLTLSWVRAIQSIHLPTPQPHPSPWRYILILSSHPRLGVWFFCISCFLVMSEKLARCINPQPGGPGDFWSRFSSSSPW